MKTSCGWGAACTAFFISIMAGSGVAAEPNSYSFSNLLVRETATLPKLQSLRFVTVEGFAPFSSFQTGGTLRGIHVDLARALCAELNITAGCTLRAVAFEDIENLLVSGQADIALAGLVPSIQNRNNLSFSVPYFRYVSKFLGQKGKALQNGAKIGVVNQSAHQAMAQVLFPKLNVTAFNSEAEAIAALEKGTLSAVFGDGLKLAVGISDTSCCELKSGNYFLPALRPDTLSAATSRSRYDVLTAVNAALRQMATDGRLDEIYLRHMPVNPLQ
jgi:polar amino acid transport system substrate-binding protein